MPASHGRRGILRKPEVLARVGVSGTTLLENVDAQRIPPAVSPQPGLDRLARTRRRPVDRRPASRHATGRSSRRPSQEDAEVIRMFRWAEICHLHLVDGVPKKEIGQAVEARRQDGAAGHRPVAPAGAGVAVAAQRPGPVAGPAQAVAVRGAAVDGEADSTVCCCRWRGRFRRARCAATSRHYGRPPRGRRPSCTGACGRERTMEVDSASRGSTSPTCRARSSTWWLSLDKPFQLRRQPSR